MMELKITIMCDCGNDTFIICRDKYNGEFFECTRCKSSIYISREIQHSAKCNEILKRKQERAYEEQIKQNVRVFKKEVEEWESMLPHLKEYNEFYAKLEKNVQMFPNFRSKKTPEVIDFDKPIQLCTDLNCIRYKGKSYPKLLISSKELRIKIKKGKKYVNKVLNEGKLHYWDLIVEELL